VVVDVVEVDVVVEELVVPVVGSVVVVVVTLTFGPFERESTTVEFFGTVLGLTVFL